MLTKKQEEFARCIVEGMTQIDAYKSAYDAENMSDNAIYVEATRLAQSPKVSLRIQELRDGLAKPTIMTAQQRLEFLTRVINGEEKEDERSVDMNAKLKAIDIMNKMQGEYVQKIVADVDTDVTINIELSDDE